MKQKTQYTTGGLPPKEERFTKRWSRLKRESQADPPHSQPALPQQAGGESEKALTDADMPDVDSLTPDSDYTGFFSPEVSESLRRLALRKLFQGAEFNIRDGLDDYDQDFTSFTKLAGVITVDMKHRLALELERTAERQAEAESGSGPNSPESKDPAVQEAEALSGAGSTGGSPTPAKRSETEEAEASISAVPIGNSPEQERQMKLLEARGKNDESTP